ncbi:MAG TPA: hypothetical protein VHT97_14225 [Acidimicrobiales bacterium]|jgi:hypothetical protein|nr:hypothetical protein [Acidimicrobiales bacterium]
MTSTPRYVEFSPEHVDEVVAAMSTMTEAHGGWVNFEPSIPVEDVPASSSGVFSLFSGRGPAVPLGTWTPPSAPRRGRGEPAMLGLQHGAGTRVKAQLAERGHPVPEGWVVVQDYAKKGLVVAVPPTADHAEVVRWLLRAAGLLSAIPLTGWRAAVYEPRSAVP